MFETLYMFMLVAFFISVCALSFFDHAEKQFGLDMSGTGVANLQTEEPEDLQMATLEVEAATIPPRKKTPKACVLGLRSRPVLASDSNSIVNVNHQEEEEKKRTTFWMLWPQVKDAALQGLDEKNKQADAALTYIPWEAAKARVKDNMDERTKTVRYNCRYCNEFGVYLSLDFYRDPSDKTYNPTNDSRLEEHHRVFFQKHEGPFPVPLHPFDEKKLKDAKALNTKRYNELKKVKKLVNHYKDLHANEELPVRLQKFHFATKITHEEVSADCAKRGLANPDTKQIVKARTRIAAQRYRLGMRAREKAVTRTQTG